jgi:hypothetical protein
MKQEEIVRVFLENIERTRKVMEDGKTGYVLQFGTKMHFICQRDGKVRKDHPLQPDVALLSHKTATTLMRWWNRQYPDDKLTIKLRREALVEYIDAQQGGIDTLQYLTNLTRSNGL